MAKSGISAEIEIELRDRASFGSQGNILDIQRSKKILSKR